MRDAWLELDAVLKERVQTVLEHPEQPVTEAELRKLSEEEVLKLSEEGRGCRLILGAELERLEQRLAELDADPASPLGAIAPAYRRVHDFRSHLGELDGLLAELETRAREVRTSRLLAARSPFGQ